MRVSVELVPKSAEQVRADAAIVRAASSAFTALNIPDLTHFDLRSWEGCRLTKDIFAASIPHIRAIDLGERQEDELCRFLHEHYLSEVLVVRGDPRTISAGAPIRTPARTSSDASNQDFRTCGSSRRLILTARGFIWNSRV